MSIRRVFRSAAIASCVIALVAPSFAQSDEERASARALAKQGLEAFNNGKYADAFDLLSRAEQIIHAPTHLLLMAQAEAKLGKLIVARELLLKIVNESLSANSPSAFRQAHEKAKEELKAIEPRIASLQITVNNAGNEKFTVRLNDQTVPLALVGVYRPVDPGSYVVGVYPVGQTPLKQSIALAEGEKKEITFNVSATVPLATPTPTEPTPSNPPSTEEPPTPTEPIVPEQPKHGWMKPAGYVGIGLGAVGAITGTAFLLMRSSSMSDADAKVAACDPNCSTEEQKVVTDLDSTAASQGTASTIGFVAGGAFLATGITLLILAPKSTGQSSTAVQVVPWATSDQVGVHVRF